MMNEIPLFDELWDYNRPEKTEARLRVLMPDDPADLEASYYIQLLTQLARTYGLRQQFEVGHALLDEAAALLTADLTIAHIRLLLERGRLLNSAETADKGYSLYQEAWQMAQIGRLDFFAIDALHMLGIVAQTAEEQLSWNLKALQLAEVTEQPTSRKWLGSLYNNTGWAYHALADYERALLMFQKAQTYYAESGHTAALQMARWAVARAYRSLGRWQEALALQQALLAEAQADEAAGYVLEEIGECLLALGQTAEASPYFGRAYAVLSQDKLLASREPDRLQRLKELWQKEL